MWTKHRVDGQEQPCIAAGWFRIRLPILHYRLEWPEVFQAVLMIAVGFSAIPLLQETLGMPFEVALTVVALAEFLNLLHVLLGDPVVPGWITSAIPLVIVYLGGYKVGRDSVHAMMALQILVALLFIFMGLTGLAHRLTRAVPPALKAGILLGAGIAAVNREFQPGGHVATFPVSIGLGTAVTFFVLFSPWFKRAKGSHGLLAQVGKYGMLPGLVAAMLVGPLVGELALPKLQWGFVDLRFRELLGGYSPWHIGFPSLAMFASAVPMALAVYLIAFGEIVTADAVLKDAGRERPDEVIPFDSNRSNLITGARNLVIALTGPFPPLNGPLWAAISIAICERYKEGRKAVDSIFGAMGSFRLSAAVCVTLMPVASLCRPVLPIALALTLLVQGFACSYIALEMVRDKTSAGIAGVMAAVVAFKGINWGLAVGVFLYLLLAALERTPKNQTQPG